MTRSKRLFFAIAASAGAAMRIADWRDRYAHCDGNPVPPENFHMTLAFIGELHTSKIEILTQATDDLLARQTMAGGPLTLDQTGYWSKPGIFWLGPTSWPDALSALAQDLRSLVSASGGKRDRNPFQPHITLFRRCNAPPSQPLSQPDIEFHLDHLALFESVQARQGVRYQALCEWSLGHFTGAELT